MIALPPNPLKRSKIHQLEIENARLLRELALTQKALELACKYIADEYGNCPLDVFNGYLNEAYCLGDDCDNNSTRCFIKYFLEQAKGGDGE